MTIGILGGLVLLLWLYTFVSNIIVAKNSEKIEGQVVDCKENLHTDSRKQVTRVTYTITLSYEDSHKNLVAIEAPSSQPEETGGSLTIYKDKRQPKAYLEKNLPLLSVVNNLLVLLLALFLVCLQIYLKYKK